MEIVTLLLSIAAVTFIGWNCLYLLSFKGERLYPVEGICVSYGLGVGLITLEMFCFYLFNIKYTVSGILAPWSLIVILNLALYSRQDKKVVTPEKLAAEGGGRALGYFLAVCLVAVIVFTFFRALIKPIEAYDAIAIYGIKSKIFYLARSIPQDYFSSLGRSLPHLDYPLNIPLFESYIYIFLGSFNDQLVKVIFPLYYIAVLGIFYYAVRRFAGRTYALIFTFMMASVSQFSNYATNAYADLPMAYYCFASAVFLFAWFRDTNRTAFLLLSALMSVLAGWTKNEGLMYCLINFIVIAVFIVSNIKKIKKKDALKACLYVLAVILMLSPFLWVRNSAHLANCDVDFKGVGPVYMVKQLYKLGPILYEFQKEFFGPKKWNILWPIAALTLVFRFKDAFRGIRKYATLSIALAVLGYIAVYMVSRHDTAFFVGKTWSRFLIHFMPLVVYWLAMMLKEDVDI